MEKNTQLTISVIIPMYNAEETIERALDSIKNQDYKGDYQILVINDGSTDNSKKVVENYITKNTEMDITLINQSNGGVSRARNTGLRNAKGEFIAFLDSDDAWRKNKIEEQIDIFRNNENIDFLGTAFTAFHKGKEEGKLHKITFRTLLFKNYFQPSTILMKSKVYKKIGYFEEDQRYAEEGNYFLRVAREFECYFYNKELIFFGDDKLGFGQSGLSANLKEMEKGELKNLKFAYEKKWISLGTYYLTVFYSLLKYLRRIIIVKLR
ncbi:glycosyltransferase family 2 protein [Riemerella anatipestifer]|uniref:glycosyltransferase family 2 protein n=1 Tax=Riemerella anatipestifer TaxID=34085 RepID=UPI00129E0B14|nr:glycosyltransferase family A protein [Riemerella anatipestifer]MRM97108.1 glycosyltransferase family 2 protein [Riemerella anatipestifer]